MDGTRFDTLLRGLTATKSRRNAVVGLLGGTFGLFAMTESEAKRKKHKKKKHRGGSPPASPPPSPPPGPTPFADATCVGTGERLTGYREAQTFLALHSGQLTSATVFLAENIGGVDLDIEIWSVDEMNVPNGRLARTTITGIPETVFPGPSRRVDATFASPATVVQGLRYGLVVSGVSFDYSLEAATGPNCPGGIAYFQNDMGSSWVRWDDPNPRYFIHFETIVSV
jgi:hypothetical protein